MEKEQILDEIRRTAKDNGDVALGAERFSAITGIPTSAWRGRYWRQWSDAVREAGFQPNRPKDAHHPDDLVLRLLELTRELKRFPTYADLGLARRKDKSFPSHHGFTERLGSVEERIELVRQRALQGADYRDVLEYLPPADQQELVAETEGTVDGFVYMLKLGKHFKIGKTFAVPRRHREIAIELPERPDVVHTIATDDPSGIEAYWHNRFAAKRTNGEWFALSSVDVRAFKRRKFM